MSEGEIQFGPKPRQEKNVGVMSLSYIEDKMLAALHRLPEEERTPARLAAYLQSKYLERFAGYEETLNSLIEQIAEIPVCVDYEEAQLTDLARPAAELVQNFFAQNFTLEELEGRSLDSRFWESNPGKFIRFNELLGAELSRSENNEVTRIAIHLSPQASKGSEKVHELFLSGMADLANRLESDSELRLVTEVEGKSWLVSQHPGILKRLGFALDTDVKGRAYMERDEFIKKFGEKVT